MQPLEQEPEMEAFLARLVGGNISEWRGATESQVEQIEKIAGRPLPPFYRWFLLRLGGDMGVLANPGTDFSATTILAGYEDGTFEPDPRFLIVGYSPDDVQPLHVTYDLDYPVRNDARVGRRDAEGGPLHFRFETLREMIAWDRCVGYRIKSMPQQCSGALIDPEKNVTSRLNPVMKALGFESLVPTGPCCGVFERSNAAMVSWSEPDEEPEVHAFILGGQNATDLRRTLGEIRTKSELMLEISDWKPPLA